MHHVSDDPWSAFFARPQFGGPPWCHVGLNAHVLGLADPVCDSVVRKKFVGEKMWAPSPLVVDGGRPLRPLDVPSPRRPLAPFGSGDGVALVAGMRRVEKSGVETERSFYPRDRRDWSDGIRCS